MLLSNRMIHAPLLGLHSGGYLLSHSKFRIFVQVSSQLISEMKLFFRAFPEKSQAPSRTFLFLPLSGIALIRCPGQDYVLRPGEILVEDWDRGLLPRYERTVMVIVEWEPGSLTSRSFPPGSQGKISHAGVLRLRRIVASLPLVGHGTQTASELAAAILAILRAEGLPFPPASPAELHEPTEDWVLQLNRVMDEAIQEMSRGPALLDLEQRLGWSPRTIQRRLRAFQEHYGFSAAGWRELLLRNRIAHGANLLSAPGANTEVVAATLGYGSSHALRRALVGAGLPPPSRIPALIRQLG